MTRLPAADPALFAQHRTNEERLRLAIEAGQFGIWDWDVDPDRVTWSDRVYELHGVSPGTFSGRVADFSALIHADDRAGVLESIACALGGHAPYEVEYRVALDGGATRWLATRAHVVRDESGRAVRVVGATYDVTSRVELLAAERAARGAAEAAKRRLELLTSAGALLSRSLQPEQTLAAIASSVVPGIADWCRVDLLDEHGVLQRALTHHADPEKTRQGTELVQRLRAAPFAVGSMAWAVATGQSHLVNFNAPAAFDAVRDRDLLTFAEAIGMHAYFVVPLIARGRTLGSLAALQAESGRVFSDDDCAMIVELAQRAALALNNARLYADAEKALRAAEEANRAKDDFLAMLGHELRNPLAPIALALHLMEQRDPAGSANERQVIARQVAHLSRLVDDLLDVARITQGKVELRREQLDLASVIARALELTQPAYEGRALPIAVSVPPTPVYVWGDAVRLAQVVCNLLTNAAKFTPGDRRVALVMSAVDGQAEIRVEDDGAGIAGELLPHLFDLFVQGEQRIDRGAGGLGLGLSIVKTLVQMHGGTVRAHSEGPDRGSVFVVRLPIASGIATPEEPKATMEPSAPRKGRLLVVDDNTDAAEMLIVLLRAVGYEAQGAADGHAAIESLASFTPDAAILDIGLPVMDGYELARRLRDDPRVPGIALIALTGYGRERDRERALSAGFDEHLVKPVEPAQLLDILERVLRR
jgi:PAS domain S-box-containing protein